MADIDYLEILRKKFNHLGDSHLAILKNGREAWREFRKDNPDVKPDLKKTSAVQTFAVLTSTMQT